jgi:hypothetical protein
MESTLLSVALTLTEPMLGTTPGNKELALEYVASKHPSNEIQEDEKEAIEQAVEDEITKSSTIFPRDELGRPFVWDYQIKGFFKDACSMLRRIKDGPKPEEGSGEKQFKGSLSSKLTSHKKVIDGLIFVYPRQILLKLPSVNDEGKRLPKNKNVELKFEERPIRVQTPQGERVAIARSEFVPEGTKIDLQIEIMYPEHKKYVIEWLEYGRKRGLGQWRNSGKGRFTYYVTANDSSAQ